MKSGVTSLLVGVLIMVARAISMATTSIPDTSTETPPETTPPDTGTICLDKAQLLVFHNALKSLTNNSDHMTQILHHINQTNNESDADAMATWLSLQQLQESVNKLVENYTQSDDFDEFDNSISSDSKKDDSGQQACSYGIAIFTLWAQVQKMKKSVSELQLNREYYMTQLERFTFLENNIKLINKQLHIQANNLTALDGEVEEFAAKYDLVMDALENQIKSAKVSKENDNVIKPIAENNEIGYSDQVDIYLSNAAVLNLHEEIEAIRNTTSGFEEHVRYIEEGHTRKIAEIAATLNNLEIRLNHLQPTSPHNMEISQPITKASCNGERRHLVGNSCYFVPKLLMETDKLYTWWDARYYCKHPDILGPDADLVVIETEEEMEEIIEMMLNHFGGIEEFWMGGNDLEKEGSWRWLDRPQVFDKTTYTHWAQTPPINTASNCMAMLQGYEWRDEPCYYQRNPFCELKFEQ